MSTQPVAGERIEQEILPAVIVAIDDIAPQVRGDTV